MSQADFWNQRYGKEEFAYGTEPNLFLREILPAIPPGSILFPAEGEGRNAVYAAGLGWKVFAFDQSAEGKRKADLLAGRKKLAFQYSVCDWQEADYPADGLDAVALVFAHMPAAQKQDFHRRMASFLKPGGLIIMEAFSKNQLEWQAKNPASGGPREPGMLYSVEEILRDFPSFEILLLEEKNLELNEGPFHQGMASVIRFAGRKKAAEE